MRTYQVTVCTRVDMRTDAQLTSTCISKTKCIHIYIYIHICTQPNAHEAT